MKVKPFSGTGPGAQTLDGCSVELYRSSDYAGEIELLAPYLQAGLNAKVSVLEFACGTGRITRRLLAMGCTVTAVDNSADMLEAAPQEATLIQADIEQLRLAQKFDVVLLPSGLINHPDAQLRAAFLAAAAAHLRPGGRFLFQRQDPVWLATAQPGPVAESNVGLAIGLESVHRKDGIAEMTLSYSKEGACWSHSFALIELDDGMLQGELDAAGFGSIEWLDARRCWAKADLQIGASCLKPFHPG
ncbi:MAG: class I SAM-dependent methyltransferase [Paucibacter sp.]|nr:class I SAM-dependent methyltransferase [Roseateles sp.]